MKINFIEKTLLIFSLSVTVVALLFSLLAPGLDADIYSCVTRLHVLANSDSEEDQKLKLEVRDVILEYMADAVKECNSVESASEVIVANLENIEKIAANKVTQLGYSYDVNASFETEYYPTREYENFRLPAGNYLSMKIGIGKAEGKNWWCVLYPPLCTSMASFDREEAQTGFTPDQVRFLTEDEDPKYVFRFKISETVAEIKYRLMKLLGR